MAVPPVQEIYKRAWWYQGFGPFFYLEGDWVPVGVSAWPESTVGISWAPPSPDVSDEEEEN